MSMPEVSHRLRRAIAAGVEQRSAARGARRAAAPHLELGDRLPPIPSIDVDPAPYLQAANSAVEARGTILGLANAQYGPQFGWNRDARTGISAPLVFGKKLDYRDETIAGDIKYLWEPNRHLHFPALAQAFVLSGDPRYIRALATHIRSWIDQCPYPLGANWASALETGIRLINWSMTWRLLGGTAAVRRLATEHDMPFEDWLRSIHQHLHFTANYYSGFSSANNHLIGEAAGVYIGCLTWPFWSETERWRARARQILVAECERQNFPDGVNREQATSYQQFVFDFLALAAIAGGQSGEGFPAAYWQRLEGMVDFIAALSTGGEVPQIGDSDDALVVGLAPDAFISPFRSMLGVGAGLFARPEWERIAGGLVDRARWMLSGVPRDMAPQSTIPRVPTEEPVRSFPVGGYHVLQAFGAMHSSVKVVFDTGPLGYLSIAAHGHADALAVLLWLDEMEFLVDAGTYAYHTEKRWRDYFRGTRAHNTLAVDGQDQSVPGGNFMWLLHADARCLKVDVGSDEAMVRGSHDAYSRLSDPVRHFRQVTLPRSGAWLTVTDEVRCRGAHSLEVFWHFSERCHVEMRGRTVRATQGKRWLELTPDRESVDMRLLSGSEAPTAGWISRHFGEKAPCTTAIWRFDCQGDSILNSHFRFG